MKILRFLRRKSYIIITTALRLLATAFAGIITAASFVGAVYDLRGYYAVGGEWIVIIGLIFVYWKFSGFLARTWWEDRTGLRIPRK